MENKIKISNKVLNGRSHYLNAEVITYLFKLMNENKLKIWVASDLNKQYRIAQNAFMARRYFNLLISLGLVEEVEVIYKRGKYFYKCGNKGYRLILK